MIKLPSDINLSRLLTLKEISYGKGFLEFLNKTTIIGVFYE
jgi:hypothetical protein